MDICERIDYREFSGGIALMVFLTVSITFNGLHDVRYHKESMK